MVDTVTRLPAPAGTSRHRQEFRILDNGLRVIALPMPEAHSAYAGFYARTGSAYESADKNGISHFLEHIVLSTTPRFPDRVKLNLEFQSVGGEFSAWTQKEMTKFSFRVHPSKLVQAGELLHECLTNESWNNDDVESERKLILNEMDSDGDDASFADLAAEVLWEDTPYAMPIIGTWDTIHNITRDDLIAHRRRYYGANNLVLSLCGNYARRDEAALLKMAERLDPGEGPFGIPPDAKIRSGFRHQFVRDPQLYVDAQLSFEAWPWNHPDAIPTRFLCFLLESSPTRLAVKLRWEAGFVYHFSADLEDFSAGGFLNIAFRSSPGRTEETVRLILDELNRLRTQPPSDEEMRLARDQYRDFIEFDLDSVVEHGHHMGVEQSIAGNVEASTIRDELDRVRTITAEEIQNLARRILHKDRLAFVAQGRFKWGELRRTRKLVENWHEVG